MKRPFFARHALFVLMAVFFCVPFAMRGSRYAVQRMKNDVKDWLPADFPETADLAWFGKRFLGEQFVVVSWDGCRGTNDDESFKTFVDKLFPELPPSAIRRGEEVPRREQFMDKDLGLYARNYAPQDPKEYEDFIGNRLSLRAGKEYYENWGQRKEKWIRSGRDQWVYITPKGEIYQWTGNRTWPAALWRSAYRACVGPQQVKGEFVASLGPRDGPWYFDNPQRLNARLFKSIYTGPSILSEMTRTDGSLKIEPQEAHDRLRGVLFGADDRQTCIVVTLTEAGKADPRALLGRGMLGKPRGTILDIAAESGIQAPKPPPAVPAFIAGLLPKDPPSKLPMLRLAGPIVDNAAIDEEGQITLARLLGLSLAVGLGLSWLCFRSINITIMVFLVGGISAVTSVGIVHWTGSQLDAVLMSMPSLVYVLGISGAVHIVNYYRESVAEHGIESAPGRAIKLGYWPCTIAAFTTSLGLMSLATSNIRPIQKFGCYAAIGVVATLVLLFTYLPAALEIWPPRRFLTRTANAANTSSGVEKFFDAFWQAVGRWVIKHYRFASVSCLLVLVFIGFGLAKIEPSIQLLKLFDGDAKIIKDYEWLEANLGKFVPMEIVIRVDPRLKLDDGEEQRDLRQLNFLERMEIGKYAAQEIDKVFGEAGRNFMGRPMLASTFAPPDRTEDMRGWWQLGARSNFSSQLEKSRQAYVDNDFLRNDHEDGSELWRISLRLAALNEIDFGDFVHEVQQVLEPMLIAYEYRAIILKELEKNGGSNEQTVFLAGIPGRDNDASPSRVAVDKPEIDQTRIFSDTLKRLLYRDQVNLARYNAGDELTADSHVVVLVQDDPLVSSQTWQNCPAAVIDARSHQFDPTIDVTVEQQRRRAQDPPPTVTAVYTGLVPIVYKAQRTLLSSLIESTGWAFCSIAVVMILLLRSARAGFLAMLPNVFPVVIVFGIMGWCNVSVDIGSMMTASVAMGVAVDDTIHFLSWFRKGIDEGHSRNSAILMAYRRVATAMTQTTAIGGIGLSIFAFSTFTPTQRFGTLMLALLVAALVGDLLFLPALLASPLGRIFDRKRGTPKSDSPNQASESGTRAPHVIKERAQPSSSMHLPPNMRRDDHH